MKNIVVCKNCGSENPFYQIICDTCKSYLREKIYNIDLWNMVALIIESPSKAFKTIIFSEHKNFLILLLVLIAGKIFLNGIFLTIYFHKWNAVLHGYLSGYIIILILTVVMFLILAGVFNILLRRFGVQTRLKDNISVIIYSFLPYTFGFLILFPIELIVFGEYLFSYNPSPFIIKETFAYTLLIFEFLLIAWSLFLTFKALNVLSRNSIYSLVYTLLGHFIFYLTLYYTTSGIFL